MTRYINLVIAGLWFASLIALHVKGEIKAATEFKRGKAVCAAEQNEAIIEEVKTHETRKKEIRTLDDTALIKRYCSSSVFDIPHDQCLRTVTYVE